MTIHDELRDEVIRAAREWAHSRMSGVGLLQAIYALEMHEQKYVSLGAVLGAGRHEDDSGVDLRNA